MRRTIQVGLGLLLLVAAGCRSRHASDCAMTFSDAGDVRVFAVGHHFALSDAVSYATYERSWRRHLADIAPCLAKDRPNLLVFPEDAGLISWFIGTRGAPARQATDSQFAFYNVYGSYADPAMYYAGKFPGISQPRSLCLALGDVERRSMDRTFGRMAKEYRVWVLAGANLPVAQQSSDPSTVSLLGDPDLGGSEPVWEATGPDCFNSALLYAPDGTLSDRFDKVYLTDPEVQQLDLSPAALSSVHAASLPFATLGIAISRDAFYPPYMQRLQDLGVDLVAQPEAWSGWTLEVHPGAWEPDAILSSGWSHPQKYRFLHSVAPMLTGNLYELYFDGQAWITGKRGAAGGFVGSETQPGWEAIGPWAYPDPVLADPSLTLAQRRAILRDFGNKLAPGSGDPAENGYADSVVAADLDLHHASPATPVAVVSTSAVPSIAIAPSNAGSQSDPAIAFDEGGTLYAVWTDDRAGRRQVFFASSADGGASFGAARAVEDLPGDEWRPSIAAGAAGRLWIAFDHRDGASAPEIRIARSADGGATFAVASGPASPAAPVWEPAIAVQGTGSTLGLVWAVGDPPKLAFAQSTSGGAAWSGAGPVDPLDADPGVTGSMVQPSIAFAPGGPAVAWIDYRGRDWSVWAAVTTAGSFASAERVSPFDGDELLASDPRLAISGSSLLLAWEEVRARRGHADVRAAGRLAAPGSAWSPEPLLHGGADEGAFASRFRPAAAFAPGPVVVFQDTAAGKSALSLSRFDAAAPVRADDTGAAPDALTRPVLAARGDGTGLVSAFEDDRDGASRVYLKRLP